MNEIEKSLEKYLLELPPNFQQAIGDTAWKQTVNKIGLANSLDAVQLTSLEAETMLILYGIEDAQDYISNITRELSIPESKAQTISNDITKEVFEVISSKAKEELEKPPSIGPVIITQETKTEALEDLSRRSIHNEIAPPSVPPPSAQGSGVAREIVPANLPMVEAGEKVHDVPPMRAEEKVEIKPMAPIRYDKGKDPYREPLV